MSSAGITLYSYWRSSAAYRARIALNLKELDYEIRGVHLVRDGGEQHSDDFHALNPQELVPVLVDGQRIIRQSLAIIEYLDETRPEQPLLPANARDRARVRSLALLVACDIHPLNNLRVLQYLEGQAGLDKEQRDAWVRHWIESGFAAFESMLRDSSSTGEYCEGEMPGMAYICLVPQVFNAERFDVDMTPYPEIRRITEACRELEAFRRAAPENQPDAPDAAG